MLVNKRVKINARISSKTTDDISVSNEIKAKYVGFNYGNLGIVTSAEVLSKGLSCMSNKKSVFSILPVEIDLRIFTIPEGFILANATLITIKSNIDNNSFYIFSCNPKDEFGKELDSKYKGKDGDMERFIAIVDTMNKTPEEIKNFKHLAVGSKCNLVCKNPVMNDGRPRITINCNIIEHADVKYFTYDKSIDINRIKTMVSTSKISIPLFATHLQYFDKTVGELEEGKNYCMSIYGFSPVTGDDTTIDFIKLKVTNAGLHSSASVDLDIGLDVISNYLYYNMLNWKCAIETIKE
mgnify:CR=1 FL=1